MTSVVVVFLSKDGLYRPVNQLQKHLDNNLELLIIDEK